MGKHTARLCKRAARVFFLASERLLFGGCDDDDDDDDDDNDDDHDDHDDGPPL